MATTLTSLWRGSIALPGGLPQSSLDSLEFLSITPNAAQSYNPRPDSENQIFTTAELQVQAVVEDSKVPLWLSCGPSFDVQTESETTAKFFTNIFVQQITRPVSIEPEEIEQEADNGVREDRVTDTIEYQATRKALVVKVIYTPVPEETEKPIITELVLYGTLSPDTPPAEPTRINASTPTPSDPTPSIPALSVYALPLSSRLTKERKLHKAVKSEPLEPNKAKFLAPIIGRKRKIDTIFTEYDKKQAYYATLPPGLRRSWHHQRSNSFGSLKDENSSQNNSVVNGDSQQKGTLFSRSLGPGISSQEVDTKDFRKTINEDPRLRRERSESVFQTKLRKAAERPDPRRESSVRPMSTGSELGLPKRTDSFSTSSQARRSHTPDIKTEFGASTRSNNTNQFRNSTGSTAAAATGNKYTERNKAAAQKLILASMRLYGLTRAKAGEVKVESEEEEYKQVFHGTLRAVTCSLRKFWNTEIIGVDRLKETTEYLMKAFVGGIGIIQGSSDKEEEVLPEEEENPFRKARIGRESMVLNGTTSRDDTLVGEESILGDSLLGGSLLGESQFGRLDDDY